MGGNQTTAHSDRSIDSIPFLTTKFWLLKIFGWRHPSNVFKSLPPQCQRKSALCGKVMISVTSK